MTRSVFVFFLLVAACAVPPTATVPKVPESEPTAPRPTQTTFGGERKVELLVPRHYDHAKKTPLVIMLHGYGSHSARHLVYSGVDKFPDLGVLVLAPDGTKGPDGRRFWSATKACCDFHETGVDDVAYLAGLVKEVSKVYNVDAARVYVWGHSNGGFMAHRLACERADVFAAIVSLAGAMNSDATACKPSRPVSVLQIHGTADPLIRYAGGKTCKTAGCDFPGAEITVAGWAQRNGCKGERRADDKHIDLDSSLDGAETIVERYACPTGVDVELWRIEGGIHSPALRSDAHRTMWQWLSDHPAK